MVAARAGLMNASRNHFLSGTRFALDQDGRVYRCDLLHFCQQRPEFRTGTDQIYDGHRFLLVWINRGLDDSRKVVGSFRLDSVTIPSDVDLDKKDLRKPRRITFFCPNPVGNAAWYRPQMVRDLVPRGFRV